MLFFGIVTAVFKILLLPPFRSAKNFVEQHIGIGMRRGINHDEFLRFLGRYGTIICFLGMITVFSVILPPFRSLNNLLNLLGQTAILSIFAAGMTCCLKMRDFDLSIGAIAAISGIVAAKLLTAGYSIPVSVVSGIIMGIIVGLVNGILVAYVGLPSLVCTLATMSIILGSALAITGGMAIWDLPESFSVIGRGRLAGIPNRFIIMFAILFALWFLHSYTITGRRMEAIGGNAEAAKLSGINVEFHRLLGFILSGFCSAVAGIILTSSVLSATATQGTHYLMDAFGACFIGAVTIRLGQFHIWGTFVGVLIVVVAINGLIIWMVPSYLTDMIRGLILLLAIMLSGVTGKIIKG